jgi:hypothetical protein
MKSCFPAAIISAAYPTARQPVEQAAAEETIRPVMPNACATLAAQLWFMMWKNRVDFIRSTLWSMLKSSKNSCVVRGLPTVDPMDTPSLPPPKCSPESPPRDAASAAARAAKTDMADMERRNFRGISEGSNGGTSAPTRVLIPWMPASSGRFRTQLLRWRNPSIIASTPRPKGETAPIPVMTTLFSGIPRAPS